jgi:hypothetical protein
MIGNDDVLCDERDLCMGAGKGIRKKVTMRYLRGGRCDG